MLKVTYNEPEVKKALWTLRNHKRLLLPGSLKRVVQLRSHNYMLCDSSSCDKPSEGKLNSKKRMTPHSVHFA